MFKKGGIAYVHFCYGMHHLFNVVTNKKEIPHAVLIRAIEPTQGIETMLKRKNKKELCPSLTSGPGALTKALGITKGQNGISLRGNIVWIEDGGSKIDKENILKGPRIGVDYAKEDALLPYRFRIRENPWTSSPKK